MTHPPHITKRDQVSAFIPLCAYSTNLLISGAGFWLPNVSFPLCSSFQPTIFEGQLCYKLKVNQTSGKGKRNGLLFLLDYQEDLSMHPSLEKEEKDYKTTTSINLDFMESIQNEEAMIQINTLSSDKQFGEGTFKMSDIKKMTATKAFLGMTMEDKRCQVESFEECRTKALTGHSGDFGNGAKFVWKMSKSVMQLISIRF